MNTDKTSETTTEGKKLYEVISTVPYQYRGRIYRDVKFFWFIERRSDGKPPVPYEEAIADYQQVSAARKNSQEGTPEEAVEELFTETEAQALKDYLLAVHHDDTATLEEVNLPLDDLHTWPLRGIHIVAPGLRDFHLLSREPGYSLPFKVWGYFDVEDCECVGEVEAALSDEGLPDGHD